MSRVDNSLQIIHRPIEPNIASIQLHPRKLEASAQIEAIVPSK